MFFSEAYHPDWNVYVNGKQKPLLRADVGYQAVELDPTSSHVEFQFENRVLGIGIWLARLNAHLWFFYTIVAVAGLFNVRLIPVRCRDYVRSRKTKAKMKKIFVGLSFALSVYG